ncbi:class I SAM-dependent methyltransferase [Candidatus Dependentiae bacterium]|nr:class I SAM-dependent methyltransferase [Candidatus Dependentiae bacterium]
MKQVHQEFDQFAKDYRGILDDVCGLTGESSQYFAQLKIQKLAEWFPQLVNKEITILDFGCGDGMMTCFASEMFKKAKVYGVDPSPKSIAIAQQKYPHITFAVNSDSDTKIELDDSMFDLVVAAGAFHHIPYRMHEGYLNELMRILKRDGILILFELNPLNPGTQLMFHRSPFEDNAKMLKPWYTYKIARPYGGCTINYYCFFPRFMRMFRPLEKILKKIPCGGLYAAIIKKR